MEKIVLVLLAVLAVAAVLWIVLEREFRSPSTVIAVASTPTRLSPAGTSLPLAAPLPVIYETNEVCVAKPEGFREEYVDLSFVDFSGRQAIFSADLELMDGKRIQLRGHGFGGVPVGDNIRRSFMCLYADSVVSYSAPVKSIRLFSTIDVTVSAVFWHTHTFRGI